ncbi:MAG: mannose-1-phosphate guanylyltransferase, partial [Candidatus Paceibacterota bacterium]
FAGGVGSRLWPLSRKNTPKQFIDLVNNKTMLQLCIDRLTPGFDITDIYISTGKAYVKDITKQLPSLPVKNIIAEPAQRDIGPAVGLVAGIFSKISPTEPIVLLWSDHFVKKEGLFRRILKSSNDIIKAHPGTIVLIGQTPRFASQNLGWIKYGKSIYKKNNVSFHTLKGFQYRPNKKTAQKYFSSGKHAWNLGYWVTTPVFLWNLFEKHAPALHKDLEKIQKAYGTKDYQKTLDKIYPKLRKISFDNAVIEKMDISCGLVVSADLGWSDVGAWEALKEALETSKKDNVIHGDVVLKNSNDNLVYNYEHTKLVVGIDLNEHLVVNTQDVLLVTKKSSVPKIKKLVESLKGTKHEKLT